MTANPARRRPVAAPLSRVLDRLIAALSIATSAILLAMMALTFADVFCRYLWSRPIFGAFEITQMMMVGIIFLGLPLVSISDGHITMDLLPLRGLVLRLSQMLAHLICAGCFAGGAWLLVRRAMLQQREGSITATLGIPTAPLAYLIAAGIACAALMHLLRAGRSLVAGDAVAAAPQTGV